MKVSDVVEASDLRSTELFRELDDDDLKRLAKWFVKLLVPAEYTIIHEGERSEGFYILHEGSVAVFRDAVGKPVQLLARLERGEFFGELGLFGMAKRTASVRTTEPSCILKITKRDLLTFLKDQPAVKLTLQCSAVRRYSSNIAATLELGQRREVRIRMYHDVTLKTEDGASQMAQLENLSLGGLSLGGAPDRWQPDQPVRFGIDLEGGVLELAGRVVWRIKDRVGVAFTKTLPNHDTLIQVTIRSLLETLR
ncbi:MAG: cyclic nucleotide-binding domain-containing protein [bacterium]|nr:cyclic nucleotide-binding domain-containing protein [bacterium]